PGRLVRSLHKAHDDLRNEQRRAEGEHHPELAGLALQCADGGEHVVHGPRRAGGHQDGDAGDGAQACALGTVDGHDWLASLPRLNDRRMISAPTATSATAATT